MNFWIDCVNLMDGQTTGGHFQPFITSFAAVAMVTLILISVPGIIYERVRAYKNTRPK